ncbi:hypothetical protein PMSD_27530 [Paenibacillus macquariensis subsp. defensor]|nr:hypothetical protein PMSD_27530 [Paenibacillus macquariensis subsp. defensor]
MRLIVSNKIKISTIITIACLLCLAGIIIIFAKSYFSESIFYVNSKKYSVDQEQGSTMTYHAYSALSVEVQILNQDRKVIIDHEEYSISRDNNANSIQYAVNYPSGHHYKVEDQSGFFMVYDHNGDIVSPVSLYVGDQRILQDGEELYNPSSLVIAAYPMYHSKQGSLLLFCLSFVLMMYGWCGYRYENFQRLLFLISLRWIWTQDPEPNDFYYFTCKVGGVLVMVGSFILAIYSLQLDIFS